MRAPGHLPLYWKICLINGAVFLVGTLVLVISPLSVSSRVLVSEGHDLDAVTGGGPDHERKHLAVRGYRHEALEARDPRHEPGHLRPGHPSPPHDEHQLVPSRSPS